MNADGLPFSKGGFIKLVNANVKALGYTADWVSEKNLEALLTRDGEQFYRVNFSPLFHNQQRDLSQRILRKIKGVVRSKKK
jgi:hypothetical protein